MAIQTFNNGETYLSIRTKINSNFIELSSTDAKIRSLSADWQNTSTVVNSNSASWAVDNSIDTGIRSLSADWQNTSTVVKSNSASWVAGGSAITTTFSELTSLKAANGLVPEQIYKISDFRLMWRNQNPVNPVILTGLSAEPLLVKAVTNNSLYETARSEMYPADIIYFDIDSKTSTTWGTLSTDPILYPIPGFKGWITRRVDTSRNIDISWDWRHITNSCCRIDISSLSAYNSSQIYADKDIVLTSDGNAWISLTGNNTFFLNKDTGLGGQSQFIPGYWARIQTTDTLPLTSIYFPVGSSANIYHVGLSSFVVLPTLKCGEKSIILDMSSEIQQPTFTTSVSAQGIHSFTSPNISSYSEYINDYGYGKYFFNFICSGSLSYNNVFYFNPKDPSLQIINCVSNNEIKATHILNSNLFELHSRFQNNLFDSSELSNNVIIRGVNSSATSMTSNSFLVNSYVNNYISYRGIVGPNNIKLISSFMSNLLLLNTGFIIGSNHINGTSWSQNILTGQIGSFGGSSIIQSNIIDINSFNTNKIICSVRNNVFEFDSVTGNTVTSLSSALFGSSYSVTIRNNAMSGRNFINNTMIVPKLLDSQTQPVFANNICTSNVEYNNFNGAFQYNVLNGHLSGNTFENNIHSNTFGDDFTGNTVLSSFEYNEVGTNCSNNVFEKNNSYNTFSTGFASNSTCDYFTKNVTEPGVGGINLTSPAAPTHVRNQYNTTLFTNSNNVARLRYFNNNDQLVVTDPQI